MHPSNSVCICVCRRRTRCMLLCIPAFPCEYRLMFLHLHTSEHPSVHALYVETMKTTRHMQTDMPACKHTHVNPCIHACMHARTYTYTCGLIYRYWYKPRSICMSLLLFTCTVQCMEISTRICIYIYNIYVYIYIYAHTHTHLYIYIYIYVNMCIHLCLCMSACMHACTCCMNIRGPKTGPPQKRCNIVSAACPSRDGFCYDRGADPVSTRARFRYGVQNWFALLITPKAVPVTPRTQT